MHTGQLVVGPQSTCADFIRRIKGHYVYILRRPDGPPFYVGKGFRDRVLNHENEARHPNNRKSNAYKLNIIRSIWRLGEYVRYEIDFVSEDEMAAYRRETELITFFRRLHEGGPLSNLAPGGGSLSGLSPISKEKHSATLSGSPENNPDRATLNGFVLGVADMNSVVIKPAAQFIPKPTLRFPKSTRKPTLRQAAALVASAAANSVSMDGACSIPRKIIVEDVEGLVENGVSCDILTSNMASVEPATDPANEIFKLTSSQARTAVGIVGVEKCRDLGVIIPAERLAL